MSAGTRSSRGERTAYALSAALLVAGSVLAVAADDPRLPSEVEWPLLTVLFAAVYYPAHRYSVDFELRSETHSVTLVQLPLALGVLLVAPPAHLVARIAAALAVAVRQRQSPLKTLYNVAAAAVEVGAAALAVGLVPEGEYGPLLWVALYLGLLVGDAVGSLALSAIWRLLGMPLSWQGAFRLLLASAHVTLVFTALTIVALLAVTTETAAWVVVVGLAVALALAYRAHRTVVSRQEATQHLYDLVKDLGPLDLHSAVALDVLERVRLLLHAERLDLTLRYSGVLHHLLAQEGEAPRRLPSTLPPTSRPQTSRGTGTGRPDRMSTPLLAGAELAGMLTATGRLGAARDFDMGDLRLLETVGAELAIALDRGRLLTDLARSATTDPLTGLPNLAQTLSLLDDLLSEDRELVLAAVAVDSFREVNDTLGHEVGDDLLREVARRLVAACGQGRVGRVGGGRFAVAVPAGVAAGDAELYGLSLRSQVEGSARIGPVGTHVRLSIGMVKAPLHGTDAATLVRRAETAMYGARQAGGGPVLWEPVYEAQGNRRLAVVLALREALDSGAIAVAYQPKVSASGSHITGVEALARWNHPALGAIGPGEFVALAETSGLIGPLTTSVLQQSLAACQRWQHRVPGVGVSVNISADTVLDPSFASQLTAVLDSTGLRPGLLTLELTESVLLQDAQLAAGRMRELRRLGVKLSVDDFGTGYSSLTYLRGLPVDEVKIDKAFVESLSSDPADQAVVRAVVDIAHTLGLRVIAEGVEQEDQMAALRSLGVDEVQGYLHARPMPELEASAWLGIRSADRTS